MGPISSGRSWIGDLSGKCMSFATSQVHDFDSPSTCLRQSTAEYDWLLSVQGGRRTMAGYWPSILMPYGIPVNASSYQPET